MTSYERVKTLVVEGKINEARLVYAREFLGMGHAEAGRIC